MSDTPTIEVKEAKVFNLPSPSPHEPPQQIYIPPGPPMMVPTANIEVPNDEMCELQQFEELEKAICATTVQDSPDKTSRDSGVSDGSSPDQEPANPAVPSNNFGGTNGTNTAIRNPSDPLPKAPVKAEVVTNELDNTEDSRKPPPYHIAAQMSRHANGFQV